MPAERRVYLFRVTEAAWIAAATEVPAGALAGRPRTGLEVRRAQVGSDFVLGVVVDTGLDAEQLDAALPGSDDGFTAFHIGPVDEGADPYAVVNNPTEAAKVALGSETPL